MALTNLQLLQAAQKIGCDVAAIRAVDEIESGGRGFVASGQIVMRFETHLFFALTGKTIAGYKRASFDKAAAINRDAAIRSTSWGRYQILGSNYLACGYSSPELYLRGQLRGEAEQLNSFVNLIKNWGLDSALRNHEWAVFARRYNGPNYAVNKYDTRLHDQWLLFSKQAFSANATVSPDPITYGPAILALVLLGLLSVAAYLTISGRWKEVAKKITGGRWALTR